ncbi:MAG: alanine racemase [Eubacteriales bacterium]|nr:alanine racemase [Eubacteriales bacterium]
MNQLDNIRDTRAEIDLDALRQNMQAIRLAVPKGALISAVIKADGYGHGATRIAGILLDNGADYLAVAIVEEGIELRKAAITVPIMILGHTGFQRADEVVRYDLEPCVYRLEDAQRFSDEAVRQKKQVKIHIKINSGMNRIGYFPCSDAEEEITRIASLPNILLEGIFTHFCTSDAPDRTFTRLQAERFEDFCALLERRGITFRLKHCCNSAAIIHYPEYTFDMVRAGIQLYGLQPSINMSTGSIQCNPVMSLKTRIVQIREICPGESVGYGRAYIATKQRTIATLPIGYADGYPRQLSGKADVLIHGCRARLIGNICMDMCMADISPIQNVKIGDEVVLFGNQCGAALPVDELAGILGTINYEIVCRIGRRVPRVYTAKGETIYVKNYLA